MSLNRVWIALDDGNIQEKEPIKNSILIQILNVLGFIAVVIINVLSSLGVLGPTNPEVSDKYPTAITPAGYAFSVWGLIYFFSAVFVIYQAFPSQRTNPVIFNDINYLFLFTCIFNVAWSIIFTYELLYVSSVMISLIMLALLIIYVRIGVGRKKAISPVEYLCIHLPFSLYFAWLCVATIVNWSVALKGQSGWNGEPWAEENWSILMMSIVAALTIIILITRTDYAFGGVISWAIFAIGKEQSDYENIPLTTLIIGSVLAGLSLIALIAKILIWRKERKEMKDENGERSNGSYYRTF